MYMYTYRLMVLFLLLTFFLQSDLITHSASPSLHTCPYYTHAHVTHLPQPDCCISIASAWGGGGTSRAASAWGRGSCSDHKFTLSFNWFLDFKKRYNCKASGQASVQSCIVIAMEGKDKKLTINIYSRGRRGCDIHVEAVY